VVFIGDAFHKLVSAFNSFAFDRFHVKQFFDSSSFSDWILISGIVQLFFLLIILFTKKTQRLFTTAIVNVIVMAFLSMPFTLISQHHTREMNSFLNSFPQNFPSSLAWQNVEYKTNDTTSINAFGYGEFYDKRISIQGHVVTPTINSRYALLLSNPSLGNAISNHKFAYSDGASAIDLKKFSPNSFSFISDSKEPTTFHIVQQYNRNWHAYVNGQSESIQPDNIAFMKIILPAGANKIDFVYRSTRIVITAWVSFVLFLGCIGLLIYFRWTKR